jgi:hypothetical protein
LRLIKGLQDRVALLEARGGSDDGEVRPAAQGNYVGSPQARLLEASIVSLHPARVDGAPGAATLAVPTFHTSANANRGAAVAINPFDGMPSGQDAPPKTWGNYTPNLGYKVANTELGI